MVWSDWSASGWISFLSWTHAFGSQTRSRFWEPRADQVKAKNIRTPSRIGVINRTDHLKLNPHPNGNSVAGDILRSMKQILGIVEDYSRPMSEHLGFEHT